MMSLIFEYRLHNKTLTTKNKDTNDKYGLVFHQITRIIKIKYTNKNIVMQTITLGFSNKTFISYLVLEHIHIRQS